MENEVVVPQMEEESTLSSRDMLIQALENAQNEDAYIEETAPLDNAPIITEEVTEAPAFEITKTEETVQPNYATKEDIIAAINAIKAGEEREEAMEEIKEMEEELPDFNSESFMDKFYDNPAEAVKEAADLIADKKVKEIEKKLAPLLNQSEKAKYKDEVKSVIADFLNKTDDAKDYFSDMSSYIKSNNLDPKDKRTYLDAYRISKINRLGSENAELRANQGKDLNSYLSDENSLSEIARNEIVKQRVIDEYLNGLNHGDKPRTIGVGGTHQPSAQMVNRPQTMRDAKEILISQLQGN